MHLLGFLCRDTCAINLHAFYLRCCYYFSLNCHSYFIIIFAILSLCSRFGGFHAVRGGQHWLCLPSGGGGGAQPVPRTTPPDWSAHRRHRLAADSTAKVSQLCTQGQSPATALDVITRLFLNLGRQECSGKALQRRLRLQWEPLVRVDGGEADAWDAAHWDG